MRKFTLIFILILFSCSKNSDEVTSPELPDPYVPVKFASFQYSMGGVYGGLVRYTIPPACSACNNSFNTVDELYYNKNNGTVKFKNNTDRSILTESLIHHGLVEDMKKFKFLSSKRFHQPVFQL